MSAWLGTEQYTTYFNHPGSDLQGGITASMSGGSLLGALLAGFSEFPPPPPLVHKKNISQCSTTPYHSCRSPRTENCPPNCLRHLRRRLRHRVFFAKRGPTHRRKNRQWILNWNLLVTSLRLPCRTIPISHSRKNCRNSTMEHRMGHPHHVSDLLRMRADSRRTSCFPHRVGRARFSRHSLVPGTILLSRVSEMARSERALGRMSQRACGFAR